MGEYVLGSRTVLRAFGAIRPNAGVILAYHNVVEPGARVRGDHSLHLPLDRFLAQVEWFASEFQVVSLPHLIESHAGRRRLGAITFDDAYAGAVRLALPELARRNLPVTLFVCSSWTGGELPWWDALADPAGLHTSIRHQALTNCEGRGAEVMAWANARELSASNLPALYRIAGADEIRRLVNEHDVTIGIHTRTHVNLCALSDEALHHELTCSLIETRQRYSGTVAWLAYPYGLYEPRVAKAARAVGYEGGVLVGGGPIRDIQALDRFAVPRVNVPSGATIASIRLRAAGVLKSPTESP